MGTKFKTPNGGAEVTVPDNQVAAMKAKGFTEVKETASGEDRKASKKPKDSAKSKAISEVESGEVRTR